MPEFLGKRGFAVRSKDPEMRNVMKIRGFDLELCVLENCNVTLTKELQLD